MVNMLKRSVVVLTPAQSIKGSVVLNSIFKDPFFRNYKFFLVVDKNDGEFTKKFAEYSKITEYDSFLREESKYDFLVSLGWGKIIPDVLIKKANIAALNCHSSYLPDYKGASVYRHYWAHTENFSGASVHLLTSEIDKGNIIARQKFAINYFYSMKDILTRASEITAVLLKEALLKLEFGYDGIPNTGGRYFYKNVPIIKLYFCRYYNLLSRLLGFKKMILPFKGN